LKKRHISLFILSHDSNKTRQIDLPVKKYKLIRNLAIVLAVIVGYVCIDYTWMKMEYLEFSNLKKKNIAQKIELNEFSKKINEVEGQLARLKDFDKKLRIIANVETPKFEEEAKMGMGGALLENVDFIKPKDKRSELVDKMHADLTQIESGAAIQKKSFIELQSYLSEKSSMLASTPSLIK
jgi:cell division protein FtsB